MISNCGRCAEANHQARGRGLQCRIHSGRQSGKRCNAQSQKEESEPAKDQHTRQERETTEGTNHGAKDPPMWLEGANGQREQAHYTWETIPSPQDSPTCSYRPGIFLDFSLTSQKPTRKHSLPDLPPGRSILFSVSHLTDAHNLVHLKNLTLLHHHTGLQFKACKQGSHSTYVFKKPTTKVSTGRD